MNVLKYEDRLLRFVQSTSVNFLCSYIPRLTCACRDTILDVPPVANSFQRLLIYRVAQRFGLDHSAAETMNESGDRGILIFKTDKTRVPDVLLINLKRPSATSAAAAPEISPAAAASGQPKIKVKVMKRKDPQKTTKKDTSADQSKVRHVNPLYTCCIKSNGGMDALLLCVGVGLGV
jgi:hypothetical protein